MSKVALRAAGELALALWLSGSCALSAAGQTGPANQQPPPVPASTNSGQVSAAQRPPGELRQYTFAETAARARDYQIGAEDLLEISVYGAPDLSGEVRVTADGSISMPLVGTVQAAERTPLELELALEELLSRTYMKHPQVAVRVKQMESHSVAVLGAVEKPGVFQVRTAKPLIEVLSLAEGLSSDAGDKIIIMRREATGNSPAAAVPLPAVAPARGDPSEVPSALEPPEGAEENAAKQSIEVPLKDLLNTDDARYNVLVYPGDVVKVSRAGVVYVVGEVNKPGGYVLKSNESISLLQAIALAEGTTHTAAGGRTRIIRTDSATGERTELAVNLKKVLAGRSPDPVLRPRDIVFVPNSSSKAALFRSTQGIMATATAAAIYRW